MQARLFGIGADVLISFPKFGISKAFFDTRHRFYAKVSASLISMNHATKPSVGSSDGGIVNRGVRIFLATVAVLMIAGAPAFADGITTTSTTSNAPGVLISGTDVSL